MALSNVLAPNNLKMYEGTKFVPTFSTDANNTYTDLGSMYIRSNDGNVINVVSKFRVVGANGGVMATNMSLPVAANATLAGKALFGSFQLLVSSSGSIFANVTNAPANNTASVIGLTSSLAPNGTYICNLSFSYNVNATLN